MSPLPARTVTACAVSQLAVVNVSFVCAPLLASTSAGTSALSLLTVTVCGPVGCVFNHTVYVAVPPSVTPFVVRSVALSASPGTSLSVTITVTSAAVSDSVVGYDVVSAVSLTACVTVSPVGLLSFTAVAVTLCAVFHVVALYVSGVASVSISTAACPLVAVIVTSPVGSAANATVYGALAAVQPPSVIASGAVCTPLVPGAVSTTSAGVSSSATLTVTLVIGSDAGYPEVVSCDPRI